MTARAPLRVVHLIAGLATGGAELVLRRLVSMMDRERFENVVISMTDRFDLGPLIEEQGIRVIELGMRRRALQPLAFFHLRGVLGKLGADVLQTWMYHADLLGGVVARSGLGVPVLWNVRASALDLDWLGSSTRNVVRACAMLSRWLPRQIVCGSESGRRVHIELGYDARKLVVIRNGFDTTEFHPDPEAGARLRSELGIGSEKLIVGLAARFHPMKDHAGFVRAAGVVAARDARAHFVLCGRDITEKNPQLAAMIEQAGLRGRISLLGSRNDMPYVAAAFDVACMSSQSEAFPNVVGEAMACGVPCVVTDVGDAAAIVGDTGVVVPPGAPDSLAEGILSLLSNGARPSLGRRARARIEEQFSIASMVRSYEEIYSTTAAPRLG